MTTPGDEPAPVRLVCYKDGAPKLEGREDCIHCGESVFVESTGEMTPSESSPSTPEPTSHAAVTPDPAAAVRTRHLVIALVTNGKSSQHRLPQDGCLSLGRDPQSPCAEALAADDSVSRDHAVIKFSADGIACIRDEDSLNGTFVNDELLPPGLERRLTAKDQFRLGEATIGHVRIAAGPAEGNHS